MKSIRSISNDIPHSKRQQLQRIKNGSNMETLKWKHALSQ